MSKLTAKPRSIFSWGFDLYTEQGPVTTIDMAWVREGGSFSWQGRIYTLKREHWMAGDFLLLTEGATSAQATKTSPFTRSFQLHLGSRRLELKAASPFTRRFVLREGGGTVGSISPNHPFTRTSSVDLPDDLSIPEQVFIFWLAILMWRRSSSSSGATAST